MNFGLNVRPKFTPNFRVCRPKVWGWEYHASHTLLSYPLIPLKPIERDLLRIAIIALNHASPYKINTISVAFPINHHQHQERRRAGSRTEQSSRSVMQQRRCGAVYTITSTRQRLQPIALLIQSIEWWWLVISSCFKTHIWLAWCVSGLRFNLYRG